MRENTPITSPAPYSIAFEPTLSVGDLVTLTSAQRSHRQSAQLWRNKNVAVVQEVFWAACDWGEEGTILDKDEWKSVPAAILLWNDGETTNTSQNVVKVLSARR